MLTHRIAPVVLVLFVARAPAQSLWSQSPAPGAGVATMNHYSFTGAAVPGSFDASPPLAAGWALPLGGDDVNRATATLWSCDGTLVAHYSAAGVPIAPPPFPAPPVLAGSPCTGLTVNPGPPETLWVNSTTGYCNVSTAGAPLSATFPIAGPVVPGTGIAYATMGSGPAGPAPTGALYIVCLSGSLMMDAPPYGSVDLVVPAGVLLPMGAGYQGIGFDTSVLPFGQLRVVDAAGGLYTLALPLGPPSPPPVPTATVLPLVGVGMDAEPLKLGAPTPCPGGGTGSIGSSGGWPVVPNLMFTITLSGRPAGTGWFLYFSLAAIPAGLPLPGGGGLLYLAPPFYLWGGGAVPAGGVASVGVPIGPALAPAIGVSVYFQFISACPGVPLGWVATNYLKATICGV